jgi:hypothetical protein
VQSASPPAAAHRDASTALADGGGLVREPLESTSAPAGYERDQADLRADRPDGPILGSPSRQVLNAGDERRATQGGADTDETATALGRQLLPPLLHYGLAELETVGNSARLRAYWEGGGYGGMTKFQVERYLAALHAEH